MAEETQVADDANTGQGDSVVGGGSSVHEDGGLQSETTVTDSLSLGTQPQTEVAPKTPVAPEGNAGRAAPINVDAELSAKELLADKLQAGLIQYDEYAKSVAAHDRNIVTAQRQERAELQETIRPIQQQKQISESNRKYFSTWGGGKDVANLKYGKTVSKATAEKLFAQAEAEYEADPMYRDRPEFDASTVVRMKWMEKMEASSKGKAPATQTAVAQQQTQTRHSGAGGAGAQQIERDNRTAKQKLEDGEYGGIIDQTENLMRGT